MRQRPDRRELIALEDLFISLVLLLLSALLPALGCACLAMGQRKHAIRILGRGQPLPRDVHCQLWAWVFLALGLVCTMRRDGGDFAMILWPMFFGIDALLVAVTIAYRPGWMRFVTALPGVR